MAHDCSLSRSPPLLSFNDCQRLHGGCGERATTLGSLEQGMDIRTRTHCAPPYRGRSGQLAMGVVDRTRCMPASAKRWKAASAWSVKSIISGTTTGEVQSANK
jgi:hypothetical protein